MAKPISKEKQRKILRDQLRYQCNRLKGAYAFKQITTFKDILTNWGYEHSQIVSKYFPDELNKTVTLADVKDFCSDRSIELETTFYLEDNPPALTDTNTVQEDQSSNGLVLYAEQKHTVPAEQTVDPTFEEPLDLTDPQINAKLFWFQTRAVKALIKNRMIDKHPANMLIAGTGTGKTYIAGAFLAYLKQISYVKLMNCLSPWPMIYITKASIVEQTKYVLRTKFNLSDEDVMVFNIDQLRAKFGQLFLTEDIHVEDGIEHTKYNWRKHLNPIVLLIDECQSVKNTDTKQSLIIQSFNDLDLDNTYQLYLSATPGSRVEDFKCFAVASKVPYTFGLQKNAPLTNNHWNDFARNIASDYGTVNIKPIDHSPKAADRLMEYLNPYIVRVKGVRPQFKAINTVQLIHFSSAKARKEYDDAWEKFLQKKAKLEEMYESMGEGSGKNYMNILSMLLVFRLAAESNDDRCEKIAAAMYDAVQNNNQAAIAALNFKLPICKITKLLIEKYKVPRSKISLIWGGAPKDNKKQKLKKKVTENKEFLEALKRNGITLKDLDLDEVEDREEIYIDPSYKLGTQNAKERQREIEKFQKGESLYCLFTFRAGGVGLSLHHSDEFTKEKVRHKKSGYAVEEDIQFIPTRQRISFVAPTWSAMELVQGLGRAPRLTSLSDTPQILMYYANTIEERVAAVVKIKLHCLSRVCRTNESWEDIYIAKSQDEAERKHIENTPIDVTATISVKEEDEETGILGDVEEDELEQMVTA